MKNGFVILISGPPLLPPIKVYGKKSLNFISLPLKKGAQPLFSVDRAAVAGGELVNLVRTQASVKRVFFEDFPCPATGGIFLAWRQRVEAFPKTLRRLEAVFHSAARGGGLAPLNTVSMSAKRPASASAMPCLNDSGIQESSFSTTNLATCARSFAGSALNCSINSDAHGGRGVRKEMRDKNSSRNYAEARQRNARILASTINSQPSTYQVGVSQIATLNVAHCVSEMSADLSAVERGDNASEQSTP